MLQRGCPNAHIVVLIKSWPSRQPTLQTRHARNPDVWGQSQGKGFGVIPVFLPNLLGATQISVVLLLLSRLLGWHASVGGFLASLLVVPASAALMRRVAAVRKHLSALTDARVKLCAEIVSGVPSRTIATARTSPARMSS